MKWAYSIQQKFKAAALLALVFVIVLFTNLLGRYQMKDLSNSFSSVIKDRLVVESYVYMLSDHLHQKELTLNTYPEAVNSNIRSEISFHNESINKLLSLYDKTLLTEEEAVYLKEFKSNIAALHKLELSYLNSSANEEQQTSTLLQINDQFSLASDNLSQLSKIQVKEGEILNNRSQHTLNSSYMLSIFEMGILVCIAIILQIIILASRSVVSRIKQQSNLN